SRRAARGRRRGDRTPAARATAAPRARRSRGRTPHPLDVMGFPSADLRERLGRLDPEVAAPAGRAPVWIHAASGGGVLSAERLAGVRGGGDPGRALCATTTWTGGRAPARERLRVPPTLLPPDLPPLVARVLERLRPAALVILETEIWPSLIRAAVRASVPVL